MIFRQLFEPDSSTYTYLLGCRDDGVAVLVDPVLESVERDLAALQALGLTLAFTIDTHIHADHITSAARLRSLTGCKIAYAGADAPAEADFSVSETDPLDVGSVRVQPLFTPGHTESHHSYLIDVANAPKVLTGDALLIDGCGRTDFQNGDADVLYRSVTQKLFSLPEDVLVYPAHDYQDRRVSSIAQEKKRNPRLGEGRTLEEFREIMAKLDLPYPKFIEFAVPGNRQCGVCPPNLPDNLAGYCRQITESPQG